MAWLADDCDPTVIQPSKSLFRENSSPCPVKCIAHANANPWKSAVHWNLRTWLWASSRINAANPIEPPLVTFNPQKQSIKQRWQITMMNGIGPITKCIAGAAYHKRKEQSHKTKQTAFQFNEQTFSWHADKICIFFVHNFFNFSHFQVDTPKATKKMKLLKIWNFTQTRFCLFGIAVGIVTGKKSLFKSVWCKKVVHLISKAFATNTKKSLQLPLVQLLDPFFLPTPLRKS